MGVEETQGPLTGILSGCLCLFRAALRVVERVHAIRVDMQLDDLATLLQCCVQLPGIRDADDWIPRAVQDQHRRQAIQPILWKVLAVANESRDIPAGDAVSFGELSRRLVVVLCVSCW
jgi:hypothetical protein